MRGNRVSVILSMAVVALSCLPAARAEGGDKSGSTASLSEVNFPISCGAAAQKKFNEAVWILHSFWYDEAVKASPPSPRSNRIARWAIGAWR